jgi:hypothetical protein
MSSPGIKSFYADGDYRRAGIYYPAINGTRKAVPIGHVTPNRLKQLVGYMQTIHTAVNGNGLLTKEVRDWIVSLADTDTLRHLMPIGLDLLKFPPNERPDFIRAAVAKPPEPKTHVFLNVQDAITAVVIEQPAEPVLSDEEVGDQACENMAIELRKALNAGVCVKSLEDIFADEVEIFLKAKRVVDEEEERKRKERKMAEKVPRQTRKERDRMGMADAKFAAITSDNVSDWLRNIGYTVEGAK